MNKKQLYNELNNLSNDELTDIFTDFAGQDKIDIILIFSQHLQQLAKNNNKANIRESHFASCLANVIKPINKKDMLFNDARAKILLEKWMPKEWLERTFKHVPDEEIEKQKKYLEGKND